MRLSDEAEHILDSLKLQLAADDKFETAWIGSDLAYKDSLFFSINFYKKYLFPIHKKLIGFLKAHNLSVMFHSDGKIDELLPYFVEAGVSGLDRLDRYADMDISGIKKQYRDKLEFFN